MNSIRITIHAVAAMTPGRDTEELVDRIMEVIEHIPGLHVQTIGTSAMDPSDVIKGSPLDQEMRNALAIAEQLLKDRVLYGTSFFDTSTGKHVHPLDVTPADASDMPPSWSYREGNDEPPTQG